MYSHFYFVKRTGRIYASLELVWWNQPLYGMTALGDGCLMWRG